MHARLVPQTPTDVSHPHTTHTPDFLRLSSAAGLLPAASGAVSDVVVRVLDTGIYPLNRGSFKPAGDGLGPPPSSFSGGCVSAAAFNASAYCNSKLIGAKFFYKGYDAGLGHPINETLESKSPLDTEGYGTHTASTAAGSPVDGAGIYNYAHGRALGMAPTVRIAAYKICWKSGCYDSDILATFDEIPDGVMAHRHGSPPPPLRPPSCSGELPLSPTPILSHIT
uniref:Peptidase S8/S53 domain-containing protein n=1 Tax=Hordeum vulgare subsp. vulgare TaxID=112509 RepID=A0A8I6Z7E1_HORVV